MVGKIIKNDQSLNILNKPLVLSYKKLELPKINAN